MRCTEDGDLRGVVEALLEQHAQLTAAAEVLGTDISRLQQKHDELVVSTAKQHQKHTQWHQDTAAQLETLAAAGKKSRLATAPSLTQRRDLSSDDACGDPSGPQLLVEGVCSCAGGLLVEGRNVTKELDVLAKEFAPTSTAAPTTMLATTAEATTTTRSFLYADYSANGGQRCEQIDGASYITSEALCELAASWLSLSDQDARVETVQGSYPVGCYWYSGELLFNRRTTWSGAVDGCSWCSDNRFDSICQN